MSIATLDTTGEYCFLARGAMNFDWGLPAFRKTEFTFTSGLNNKQKNKLNKQQAYRKMPSSVI
jgi:hypothetical protein